MSFKLDKRSEDFCNLYGTIGIFLSTTCLLQLLYFMLAFWTNWLITAFYIFGIISFSLMVKKHQSAPLLLMINSILLFLVATWFAITQTYSPILWICMCYSIVISILMYVDGINKKLILLANEKKIENAYWQNQE